jgi:uncharacterized protein (TIGR02001 family)
MFKKTLIASALLVGSSAALAEISGNVTMATDYIFRGISQTDNQLAIQGGLDYAHDSGFYLGTWASNIDSDFFNPGDGHDPQIELDLYGGYSGELANGIGYDLGYIRYEYPGYGAADTNEVYLGGSFNNFSAKLVYSDELAFFASKESAWYLSGGYDMELPEGFGLSASLGYSFGDAFDNNDGDGLNDSYLDWSIGISKTVAGVDLGLTYTDVDFSDSADDCRMDFCDTKFVFSIGKSL